MRLQYSGTESRGIGCCDMFVALGTGLLIFVTFEVTLLLSNDVISFVLSKLNAGTTNIEPIK